MSRSEMQQQTIKILPAALFFAVTAAAVLVPNLLDAIKKQRMKTTTTQMRNIGSAWLAWLTDQVGAPSAGANKYYSTNGHLPISSDEVAELLQPEYLQEVPLLDGWGNRYSFTLNTDLYQSNVMAIYSPGRDGVYDTPPTPDTEFQIAGFDFTSSYYDEDVIWADGYFVRWPAPGCR